MLGSRVRAEILQTLSIKCTAEVSLGKIHYSLLILQVSLHGGGDGDKRGADE